MSYFTKTLFLSKQINPYPRPLIHPLPTPHTHFYLYPLLHQTKTTHPNLNLHTHFNPYPTHLPSHLTNNHQNFILHSLSPRPTHHMLTHLNSSHLKPRHLLNLHHTISSNTEPTSYKLALQIPHCNDAMTIEYNALLLQQT